MSNPLVSILIPAYNCERWIGDTIISALNQTWRRSEIIVVDDGSQDSTLALARTFESRGVKVFTQKNMGAAATRNAAFSLSSGDFIQWLDGDDLLAPDKIERQLAAISPAEFDDTVLSGAWGRFILRPWKAKFNPTPLWCDLLPVEWLIRKMEHNVFIQTGAWLVPRKIAESVGPWDTRLLGDDDGEYFCRVLLASRRVKFVPEAKVFYRTAGPGSLSYVGRSKRKLEALYLSMSLHLEHLQAIQDTDEVRDAAARYLKTALPLFYPEHMDLVNRIVRKAAEMGRRIEVPPLSWKYRWIEQTFGLSAAKQAQFVYDIWKCRFLHGLDGLLYSCSFRRRRIRFP